MNAMIFAAGLGTRLRPLTNDRPKALVEVGGKTLLEHAILRLRQAGFSHLVVNVHHFGEQIISFLDAHQNFGLDIRVSDERGLLLDTGGGLRKALPLFENNEPVLIHNVDIVSGLDLQQVYASHRGDATLVVSQRNTSRYLLFDETMNLRGWTNVSTGEVKGEKAPLMRAFAGIHVVSQTLLPALDAYASTQCEKTATEGVNREVSFPIVPFYIAKCNELDFHGYEMSSEVPWVDCGKVESLEKASKILL